jgi:hyperosmotically inducible protein
MKIRSWISAGTMAGVLLAGSISVVAQQGTAEKIGESLDRLGKNVKRGVGNVADDVRAQFAKTRESVHSWGAESRVYGRLHWDVALNKANLETHVDRAGVVTLYGVVTDEAARAKAVKLAGETVGITKVVDQLSVATKAETIDATTDAP